MAEIPRRARRDRHPAADTDRGARLHDRLPLPAFLHVLPAVATLRRRQRRRQPRRPIPSHDRLTPIAVPTARARRHPPTATTRLRLLPLGRGEGGTISENSLPVLLVVAQRPSAVTG